MNPPPDTAPDRDSAAGFRDTVEQYQARMYGFLSRMCRSREDARDALQDTFLSAFRAFENFRGESAVSTWLYRIATNACLKIRRRGKYEPERELSLDEFMPSREAGGPVEIADGAASPERVLLDKELQQALERAIAELPGPYRIVLVLRDVEGLPAEEVAQVLGLSVAAVKSRLHRARLFLRQRLAEHASPGRESS
jgi:RNA polymerase sigma-70 factor, ECF subfamily